MEIYEIVLRMIKLANQNNDCCGFESDKGIVYIRHAEAVVSKNGLEIYNGIDPVKLGESISNVESDTNEWHYFS